MASFVLYIITCIFAIVDFFIELIYRVNYAQTDNAIRLQVFIDYYLLAWFSWINDLEWLWHSWFERLNVQGRMGQWDTNQQELM